MNEKFCVLTVLKLAHDAKSHRFMSGADVSEELEEEY